MKKVEAAEFTKAMKATHTILLPDMLHYHNALLQAAFDACGYHLEILPEEKNLPGYSLPYISGDYCLPTVLILGQIRFGQDGFNRSGSRSWNPRPEGPVAPAISTIPSYRV